MSIISLLGLTEHYLSVRSWRCNTLAVNFATGLSILCTDTNFSDFLPPLPPHCARLASHRRAPGGRFAISFGQRFTQAPSVNTYPHTIDRMRLCGFATHLTISFRLMGFLQQHQDRGRVLIHAAAEKLCNAWSLTTLTAHLLDIRGSVSHVPSRTNCTSCATLYA